MSNSREAPSSSSAAPAKRLKPMDREERIGYLEFEIAENRATLSNITKMIEILSDKHLALMKVPKADRDVELLAVTEKALAHENKYKDLLIADITKHEAELQKLREQPSVATSSLLSTPPAGKFCVVPKYITLYIYNYVVLCLILISLSVFMNQVSLLEFLQKLYIEFNQSKDGFLDPNFDTIERILFPANIIDMPAQDRGNFVNKFWESIGSCEVRKPIYFIQGSPGCGKVSRNLLSFL